MNKEYSELNKTMQIQLKKEATFSEGINTLLRLRTMLFDVLYQFKTELTREDFNAIPFMNANGYHNKTIIYSIWHLLRIEDIVVHTLIQGDEQIFFCDHYQKRIQSPIITTGNELLPQQIVTFSSALNLDELYLYMEDVTSYTNKILKTLSFSDLKKKIDNKDKEHLVALEVVSTQESAHWLIDYWCNKQVKGLVQMPLSRHWIMHIEACLRIKNKIN